MFLSSVGFKNCSQQLLKFLIESSCVEKQILKTPNWIPSKHNEKRLAIVKVFYWWLTCFVKIQQLVTLVSFGFSLPSHSFIGSYPGISLYLSITPR